MDVEFIEPEAKMEIRTISWNRGKDGFNHVDYFSCLVSRWLKRPQQLA